MSSARINIYVCVYIYIYIYIYISNVSNSLLAAFAGVFICGHAGYNSEFLLGKLN